MFYKKFRIWSVSECNLRTKYSTNIGVDLGVKGLKIYVRSYKIVS